MDNLQQQRSGGYLGDEAYLVSMCVMQNLVDIILATDGSLSSVVERPRQLQAVV